MKKNHYFKIVIVLFMASANSVFAATTTKVEKHAHTPFSVLRRTSQHAEQATFFKKCSVLVLCQNEGRRPNVGASSV